MPEYAHTIERLGSTHMPLFWREKTNRNGMPVWTVDIQTIFAMLGDEWDAIIECECFNLETDDNFDLIDKIYDIPYFFYKTQYLEDYVPPHATHIFYAAELIKDKLLKDLKETDRWWNYEWGDRKTAEESMIYLPLTVDPEIVKNYHPGTENFKVFFCGNVPDGKFLPEFEEAYKMRKEVIDYLEKELDGEFCCFRERKWQHTDYLKMASKASIILNIGIGGLNIRDFEALAMGKTLVTWNNQEYQKNHLRSGVEFAHFKNEKHALDVIKYLLETPEEMEILCRNGKKVFDKYHHPNNRIKVIIEAIKNAK
jgi:hypothetical protein